MTTFDESRTQRQSSDRTGASSATGLSFTSSLKPVLVFFLVSTFAVPVLFVVADQLLPRTPFWSRLFTATAITSIAVFAWGVLRWEGLSAGDVGLDRNRLVSGTVSVVVIWFVINVLSYALLAFRGEQATLGLPASPTNGLPVGASPTQVAGMAITLWIFVGIAEEFAFRGYFQNKLVALTGGGTDRVRTAAGIVLAAVFFALWHLPQMVAVRGIVAPEMIPALLALTIYTVILGTLYELTRNIVFVGLLHGTLDLNPIFVVGETGAPVTELGLLVYPLIIVTVVLYRRWAKTERTTDFRPQTTGGTE